MKAREEMRQQL